jgi:hypothetical protein
VIEEVGWSWGVTGVWAFGPPNKEVYVRCQPVTVRTCAHAWVAGCEGNVPLACGTEKQKCCTDRVLGLYIYIYLAVVRVVGVRKVAEG